MSRLQLIAALMVIVPLAANAYYISRRLVGGRQIATVPFSGVPLGVGGYGGVYGGSNILYAPDFDRPDRPDYPYGYGGVHGIGAGRGYARGGIINRRLSYPIDGSYRTAGGVVTRDGSDLSYDAHGY